MPDAGEIPIAETIDENVRLTQKLARDLRNTRNARRSFEISQELAQVVRELKEATRIESELARSARSG